MTNSNKIIINTVVSYIALCLKMAIGLFSVKFILQALGSEDYGIYIIVGGIVAMLDILNSNMSNTSMRYLAHSLGSRNVDDIYITFNTTVVIHYFIGLVSILILEFGGFFMFEHVVNIPNERIIAAKIIYQFMIATTFISIISVPYDAVTNAHEKIWVLSVFDVVYVVFTLVLSVYLLYCDGDRLIYYGLGLLFIHLIISICKVYYAKRHFSECRILSYNKISKSKIKEILSFTGWNLFGSIAALGITQFRSFILNIFFGVRLNAAEGISRQVGTPLSMMVSSMTRAINPQIMKSEGSGNHERMKFIVALGAKYSTFLFALFGIPILIEMPFILEIWLDEVPQYAVIFCRLLIFAMLIEKFTFQICHAISAVGIIRNFQIVSAIGNFIYLPIAWIMFKNGYSPSTIYWLSLFSNLIQCIVRLYYGKTIVRISPKDYVANAISPILIPLIVSTLLALVLYHIIEAKMLNLIIVSISFVCVFFVSFWLCGMNDYERTHWQTTTKQFVAKIYAGINETKNSFYMSFL